MFATPVPSTSEQVVLLLLPSSLQFLQDYCKLRAFFKKILNCPNCSSLIMPVNFCPVTLFNSLIFASSTHIVLSSNSAQT